MDRKNIGLIGVGRIGEVHLRHLVQSGRVNVKYLVAIEPVHSRIHDLMKQHGLQDVHVITTEEVEKLFNDTT